LLIVALVILAIAGGGYFWWQRGPAFVIDPGADQNVLLVTIDTLRGDVLSSYGGPAATPNLDALASHGARFTFAHAHAVVTLVSHTTILTGQLPYEHGMRDNSGYRVKDGTATVATRLKAMGFSTGAFVGGFPLTKRFGLTPGFDVYDDQMPEMKGDSTFSMPERPANEVVSRAVAWMDQQPGKFFEWVHVFDAHSPYRPPAEFADTYNAQPYYGEVAWIDHALGPLFDHLSTLSRPTTVIVTADHGESLGEHGEATHGMFAYEATLRVPLIIARVTPRQPRATRGVVIDAPVRHLDILPTVLDAIGAQPDTALAGSSLRELIHSGSGPDRPSYFESMTYNLVRGWAPLRGVLVTKEKYIDLPIPELYDLIADPQEARNLAVSNADRARVLLSTLKTYNLAPPNRPMRESAGTTAALNSLGYVAGAAPAKDHYTEADDPKNLSWLDRDMHTATELSQSGRAAEGITILKRVIAMRPDTADAYMSLSYAYWQAGQTGDAIAALESGLKAGAPDRDIRIRLGIYLAESHTDYQRAITVLEGLPDSDVEALNGLGIAYIDAKRFAEAKRTLRKALALDPTNGLALQNLGVAALSEFEATNRKNPALLNEAHTSLTLAIEADPTLAGAYTAYGVTMSYMNKKSDAIVAWKKAVELDPSDSNTLYNLWLELARAGRRDEAVTYGQQFLAATPPNAQVQERAEITKYISGR
jgi:arylsulfatase A-like enzyme/Flp pilus assembly protein TadD